MKILLVAKKNRERYWYENLFREELIRTSGIKVYPFGKGYTDFENTSISLLDKIESVGGVDVVFVSFYWALWLKDDINRAKALKVNFAADYYEGARRIGEYEAHYSSIKYDIIFGYGTIILDYLKDRDIGGKHYYLPFGVDINRHRKLDLYKTIDVNASYTTVYAIPGVHPYREEIQDILGRMPITIWTAEAFRYDMIKKVNESKICVNCNARYKFVNPRVTEVMACGTFLLTDYNDDLIKFGYKDEEHLVLFHNMNDFKDKVEYFLKHDKEREEIAENGMNFVRKNYSNEKRVETFLNVVRRHL